MIDFLRLKFDRKASRTRWFSILLLTAPLGLSGCGNSDSLPKLQVYGVKGKVLLADGKPLQSGWSG